jgi:hypothetical protein
MFVLVEAEVRKAISEGVLEKLVSIVRWWRRLSCLNFTVSDVWLLWKQTGNKKSNGIGAINKLSIKSPGKHHLGVKTSLT